jgi:7-cyano-7-deazaguanine synthase
MTVSPEPVVVLLGGGVESTALVKQFLAAGRYVAPVRMHCGLIWDDCESAYARRFCEANAGPSLAPLVEIHLPLHSFLAGHWAVTGVDVPRAGAASSNLEIPLRNLTLLGFVLHGARRLAQAGMSPPEGWALSTTGKASTVTAPRDERRSPPYGRLSGAITLALGTTADNNYPDGSRAYFDQCEKILSLEAGHPVMILTPLIEMTKFDVIRRSDRQTLSLSFSCVDPQHNLHCGRCIKCGRRQAAFREAHVDDPTQYAT